jgi:uncharacterized protein
MRPLNLLLVLLACAAAVPAVAGPFEDAITAYNKGDYATTLRLFLPLAAAGDAEAQYNLGVMYDNGKGVPQDSAMAMSWFRKSAAQGNADAQYNLGVMYDNGKGVPQDYVQAHMWFNLAASRSPEGDQSVKNRDLVAAKMTPAQIAEAQKLAREWKPKTGK